MTAEESIRRAFARQSVSCAELGSPFTALVCSLAAERLTDVTEAGKHILSWPGNPGSDGDALALRFAGALHGLVRSGAAPELARAYPPNAIDPDVLWAAVEEALHRHRTFIIEQLKSPPQTNEVRRSAALLPGFLTIAKLTGRPLVLSEIGASAGLNLIWDRYAYRLGDFYWGGPSSVTLSPEWEGPALPGAQIEIAERAACDLNPLDPEADDDRLRLMSYIWADQPDRLQRTESALDIAAASTHRVERCDAVDWLQSRLDQVRPGAVHVIYHSIAWQYLPESSQAAGDAMIASAGARSTPDAPLARLSMEADGQRDGAALALQLWPPGKKHQIGRADFHGRWIRWTGLSGG